MSHFVKVTDPTSGHFGTDGNIERIYWREEVPWVRIRSRDGTRLSVPWGQTDLPTLTVQPIEHLAPLTAPVLIQLVYYLEHRGKPSSGATSKPTPR